MKYYDLYIFEIICDLLSFIFYMRILFKTFNYLINLLKKDKYGLIELKIEIEKLNFKLKRK